jgi:hypothetical protein
MSYTGNSLVSVRYLTVFRIVAPAHFWSKERFGTGATDEQIVSALVKRTKY